MAIAEMPGDARQGDRVLAADFGERFGRGDNFDDAPVVKRQSIAGAQHYRFRQIEKKSEATNPGHRQAAAITIVVVQYNAIGWRAGPGAGRTNGTRREHGMRLAKGCGSALSLQALARRGKAARYPA
jgi:hypothetical protein